jgi:hypothetical protein
MNDQTLVDEWLKRARSNLERARAGWEYSVGDEEVKRMSMREKICILLVQSL